MARTLTTNGKPAASPPEEADSVAVGKAARRLVPRTSHGEWEPAADRPDPVALLEEQAATRVPYLVPIRHGRMLVSSFAFYRGAAIVMANDLGRTPSTGLRAQACGDAHASNFGIFASPEREMLFDVNDFDESAPGPFEWDLKRLVASLAIAGRMRGFSKADRRQIVEGTSSSYRSAMQHFAGLGNLAVWYSRLDLDVLRMWRSQVTARQERRIREGATKAASKDSTRALEKLTEVGPNGELRFRSEPPLLVPVAEWVPPGTNKDEVMADLQELVDRYASTLRPELRALVKSYRFVDLAHKVVGVGSVGLRAWVILMLGRGGDPLVLQAKEAQASVLEPFAGASEYSNHGERVVVGQRSMQAASDIFLGWVRVPGFDGVERDFYLRQLWDWKGSVDPQQMVPNGMRIYGEVCAWTLARAHARTGDPVAIAAYCGSGATLDQALGRFAEQYADQNERDYAALNEAAASGRIAVERETV